MDKVATWPDEIRYDPNWKKADPWHFMSIDDRETLETTARDPAGTCRGDPAVHGRAARSQETRESKQEALDSS